MLFKDQMFVGNPINKSFQLSVYKEYSNRQPDLTTAGFKNVFSKQCILLKSDYSDKLRVKCVEMIQEILAWPKMGVNRCHTSVFVEIYDVYQTSMFLH